VVHNSALGGFDKLAFSDERSAIMVKSIARICLIEKTSLIAFLMAISLNAGSVSPWAPSSTCYAQSVGPPAVGKENVMKLPRTRQGTDHTCGVSSLQSILGYYGEDIREDKLAKETGATSEGVKYTAIADFARSKGLHVEVKLNMTVADLRAALDQRRPTIVALQAWRDKPGDWANDWEDGHYVVAIGYDKDNFYFMDPSVLGNYAFIPVEEFLTRWHDVDQDNVTKVIHAGISIWKDTKPAYDPDAFIRIE
jgi:predicted double-glycine peptidase